MVKSKYAIAGLFAAALMIAVPTPAHAQQASEEIIALLEQILQLTQLVLALQMQLDALEAAGVTTNNTPAVVGAPNSVNTPPAPQTPQQPTVAPDNPNEVLTLPVYIHLVQSSYEDIQAQTLPADLPNIFALTNSRYWNQANIQWVYRGVLSHTIANGSDADYANAVLTEDEQLATSQLGRFTEGATLSPGFNVFVVHNLGDIPYNGRYFNTGIAVISETNSREGGEDYIAYLLAHELGHALGLDHEGGFGNLMHPGQKENDLMRSERTMLTSEQIANARAWARTGAPYNGATQ